MIRTEPRDGLIAPSSEHSVGKFDNVCRFCNALYFSGESSKGKYTKCCHSGAIALPDLQPIPDFMKELIRGTSSRSLAFIRNARDYNNVLACASMGVSFRQLERSGPSCLTVNNQIMHYCVPAFSTVENAQKFAQIYCMDPDTAIEHRLKHPNSSHLDKDVISALDSYLRSHNEIVKSYQMLREFVVAEENRAGLPTSNVVMRFYEGESTSDETGIRRPFAKAGSSVPVSNEIAYITTHNDGEITNFRDIIVYPRGKKFERTDTRNARCDAFSYVLLHLDGKDLGWDLKCSELKITLMKFYAFRLANREGSMNQLLRMGNLTGQYIID